MICTSWLLAATIWSKGLDFEALHFGLQYEVAVPTDHRNPVWPGPGVDFGVDPWHFRYVYQARFFGDGLDGDEVFLGGEKPRLQKYRHRLTTSWEHWKEIFRFEVGAGWAWSRVDALEEQMDPRPVFEAYQAFGVEHIQERFDELHWYRLHTDRQWGPVGLLGIGFGRRERWMIGVLAEYWKAPMYGLTLRLRLL
ncbi:MAG: hypothetical protein IPN71_03570 [Fibrobacteres bacterium]|nr:hypothetical protein [Fibrobacterota bacterium]